jgi:DNA-binding NtrC family response regulator
MPPAHSPPAVPLHPTVAEEPVEKGGEMLPVAFAGPFKSCKDELVRAFEREYLTRLLTRARGNIARAAREAQLDRKHLYSLLHKHGLVHSAGEPVRAARPPPLLSGALPGPTGTPRQEP